MFEAIKFLILFGITIGFSEGFLARPSRNGAPITSSFIQSSRHVSSVAVQSQRTNYTTFTECFEIDKAILLESLSEQHSKLKMLNSVRCNSMTSCADELFTAEEEDRAPGDVWNARLLLIGASALYGTNFALVKLLGEVMPVGVSSSFRFGLAAFATLPWLLKDCKKDGALTATWLGFEVGLWNSIGYVAQAVGLETTPASESAFICSLAVVTVPLLEFLAGKRLLPRQWIGAIMAVAGVAFLELGGEMSSECLSTGDMLSLIQPFAFGIGFWRMEQAMHRFPTEAPRLTAAQLLAVFGASVTYGLWAIDLDTLQTFPWIQWLTNYQILLSLLWTGVITTALTIYMENLALETLSAAETTLIFSTEPLWGTAFAAAVMGEQLGVNAAVGAVLILSACVYSNLGWQGLTSIIDNGMNANVLRNHSLPKQQAWFTSNLATSLASWFVVASVPKLESLRENSDVEEVVTTVVENLP